MNAVPDKAIIEEVALELGIDPAFVGKRLACSTSDQGDHIHVPFWCSSGLWRWHGVV
jgi:hypothetical protein